MKNLIPYFEHNLLEEVFNWFSSRNSVVQQKNTVKILLSHWNNCRDEHARFATRPLLKSTGNREKYSCLD